MSGTRYDEGIELARLLVATGPFNPREVSARQWELLSQAFEALFPFGEIGCQNGGCPNKVSIAYQKVTYKLREAEQQTTAPLAQQSAASLVAQPSPTTQPTSAAEAAPANMSARTFNFQPGKSYREMSSNVTYTNDNLTDKAARRIISNDPSARRLFVPFENSALAGDVETSVASSSVVTGNYGQSIDQAERPADRPSIAIPPRIARAVEQIVSAAQQQIAAGQTAPAAASAEPTGDTSAADLGDEHDGDDEHDSTAPAGDTSTSTQSAAATAPAGDGSTTDLDNDDDDDSDDDELENDLSAADAANPMTEVFGAMKRKELDAMYLQLKPGSNPAVFQNKGEIIKALVAAHDAANAA
jgi:hypothetical protein